MPHHRGRAYGWRPVASPRRRLPSSPPSCWVWSPEHSSRRRGLGDRIGTGSELGFDRHVGSPVSGSRRPHPGGRGGSGAVHREQPDRDERCFRPRRYPTAARELGRRLSGECGSALSRWWRWSTSPNGGEETTRGRRDGTLDSRRLDLLLFFVVLVRASSRTRWSALAVWLAAAGRSVIDKVAAIVFPISALVTAGFEHSVANMFFIRWGSRFEGRGRGGRGDIPSAELSTLDGAGLVEQPGPATIGNVIGERCWSGPCTGSSTSARRARPDVAGP